MKIRESIADKTVKWWIGGNATYAGLDEAGKELYDKWVAELFAIREDGGRLAIVKEKGGIPFGFFDWCEQLRNGQIDAIQLFKYLTETHYVQEVLDD